MKHIITGKPNALKWIKQIWVCLFLWHMWCCLDIKIHSPLLFSIHVLPFSDGDMPFTAVTPLPRLHLMMRNLRDGEIRIETDRQIGKTRYAQLGYFILKDSLLSSSLFASLRVQRNTHMINVQHKSKQKNPPKNTTFL